MSPSHLADYLPIRAAARAALVDEPRLERHLRCTRPSGALAYPPTGGRPLVRVSDVLAVLADARYFDGFHAARFHAYVSGRVKRDAAPEETRTPSASARHLRLVPRAV